MDFLLGCLCTFIMLWFLNWINFEISVKVGNRRYTFSFVGMKFSSEGAVAQNFASFPTFPSNPAPKKDNDEKNLTNSYAGPLSASSNTNGELTKNVADKILPNETIPKESNSEKGIDRAIWEKKNLSLDIIEKIESAVSLLLTLVDEKEDWEILGVESDVEISKKNMKSSMQCVRGKAVVRYPPGVLAAAVNDLEKRGEWDQMFKDGKIMKEYNPSNALIHMMYKQVWPTTARDFLNFTHQRFLPSGGILIAAFHHRDDLCPPQKNYVRAEAQVGGYLIQPLPDDPNSCFVVYISCFDLKGSLPSKVVQMISTKQPLTLDALRKFLAAHPEYLSKPLLPPVLAVPPATNPVVPLTATSNNNNNNNNNGSPLLNSSSVGTDAGKKEDLIHTPNNNNLTNPSNLSSSLPSLADSSESAENLTSSTSPPPTTSTNNNGPMPNPGTPKRRSSEYKYIANPRI